MKVPGIDGTQIHGEIDGKTNDTSQVAARAVVGKTDPRVPWTESRQILDKLNAQGTATWFLMANDEGHGSANNKSVDFLFDAEVMFIQKYLLKQIRRKGVFFISRWAFQ